MLEAVCMGLVAMILGTAGGTVWGITQSAILVRRSTDGFPHIISACYGIALFPGGTVHIAVVGLVSLSLCFKNPADGGPGL